jgi:hypothetical protein
LKPRIGRICLSLLVLAALTAVLGGCGLLPGGGQVAQVGKSVLTVAQFQTMMGQIAAGPTPPDSAHRAMLVDMWVSRAELVADALESRMDTLSAVATQLREQVDPALAEALYKKSVLDKIKVGEADIKALYDKRKEARQVAHISTSTRILADEAKRAIDGGMPFEEVTRRFSMDQATAANGGVVPGEFSSGDLPAELDSTLFALKVGDVSAPVAFQGGFEILKLVAAKPAQQPPFEQARATLESTLRKKQQAERTKTFVDDLKKKRRFAVDEAGVRKLVALIQAQPGDTLPEFAPVVLNEPLARFEGGPYTVGDLLRDARNTRMLTRPNFNDEHIVSRYVDNGAVYPMLIAEAKSLKLDRDAGVKAALQMKREEVLSRAVVAKLLGDNPHPGDQELRAEYEKIKSEFVNGGRAEVLQIVTPVEPDAQRAAGEARANVPFATLLKRYSRPNAEEARGEGQAQVIFDGTRPALEDSLRGRAPGQVVGPIALGGRYFVFQVQMVQPAMNVSYDEARMSLMQRVSRDRQKQVLDARIAELKKRFPPKINVKAMLAAKPVKPESAAGGN